LGDPVVGVLEVNGVGFGAWSGAAVAAGCSFAGETVAAYSASEKPGEELGLGLSASASFGKGEAVAKSCGLFAVENWFPSAVGDDSAVVSALAGNGRVLKNFSERFWGHWCSVPSGYASVCEFSGNVVWCFAPQDSCGCFADDFGFCRDDLHVFVVSEASLAGRAWESFAGVFEVAGFEPLAFDGGLETGEGYEHSHDGDPYPAGGVDGFGDGGEGDVVALAKGPDFFEFVVASDESVEPPDNDGVEPLAAEVFEPSLSLSDETRV